jgi:DNA-binding transcriptional ArsR family regulator
VASTNGSASRDLGTLAVEEPEAMPTDIERVLRALASELRIEILDAMLSGAPSPVQVSRRLDLPLGTVAYHVRFLREAGLITIVEKRPARGAVENLYEVTDLGRRARTAVTGLLQAVSGDSDPAPKWG